MKCACGVRADLRGACTCGTHQVCLCFECAKKGHESDIQSEWMVFCGNNTMPQFICPLCDSAIPTQLNPQKIHTEFEIGSFMLYARSNCNISILMERIELHVSIAIKKQHENRNGRNARAAMVQITTWKMLKHNLHELFLSADTALEDAARKATMANQVGNCAQNRRWQWQILMNCRS